METQRLGRGIAMSRSGLPEKARLGLTWRRFKNIFCSPLILFRNIRFWWNEDVSQSKHIFVMGPPRTGTTLIKNVLQSHSEICGVEGETWFFLRRNYVGFRHQSLPNEEMEQIIRDASSPVDLFDRFAQRIRDRNQGDRFLEKTPEHALRLEYILSHFPESHFVFVVRDPRDGLRSAKDFPGYWATLPVKDRMGGYIETWQQSVDAYLKYAKHPSVLKVRYEDFCRKPNQQLKRLSNFLNISPENHQLCPDAYSQTSVKTVSGHVRLKEQITSESVGKWRQKLTTSEVIRIESRLSEQMKALGYSLSNIH